MLKRWLFWTLVCVVALIASRAEAQTQFGSVAIGSSSAPQSVTVTVTEAGALGSVGVLTGGVAKLDFASGSGGSCQVGTSYAAGDSCTVNVMFTPMYSGSRKGGVVLSSSTGTVMGTAWLLGSGLGAQLGYFPASPGNPTPLFIAPSRGIAVDAGGNLYVCSAGSYAGSLVKATPSSSGYTFTKITSSGECGAVAGDAAGNVYTSADGTGNTVLKETLMADGSYSESTVATSLGYAFLIAVDVAGNVYVEVSPASTTDSIYKETLQADGTYVQSTVDSGLPRLTAMVVDVNQNIIVADNNDSALYEETLSKGSYTRSTISQPFNTPVGLAIDGRGDLILSTDYNVTYPQPYESSINLVPLLADGTYDTYNAVQFSTGNDPEVITIDQNNNIYSLDGNAVKMTPLGMPPTLSFANTQNGQVSSDSPQTATPWNLGTAALQFSAISYPADFPAPANATGSCTAATSLAPLASCAVPVTFKPIAPTNGQQSLALNEAVSVSTNSLSPTQAPTKIPVTGTEVEPQVATPVLAVTGSATPVTVTITDATHGATIHYSLNTAATDSSPVYTGPITLTQNTSVYAIAIAPNYIDSSEGGGEIDILVPTPVISPGSETHAGPVTVTITDSAPGSTIIYGFTGGLLVTYTGPFTISSSTQLQAYANAPGLTESFGAIANYTIIATTPVFSPGGGSYTSPQNVTITDATSGAVIYYTTDGSAPTTSSSRYSGPIQVSTMETVRAIAVASGYAQSAVATAAYTILQPAVTPVISPAAGSYTSAQSVTISDATSGAVIYYTVDGSAPTTSSARYSGAITVSATETIKAIAAASGYAQSAVATAAYVITSQTAMPVISPAGGTFTSAQSVTITDATSGAVIYYTTDGSTPTAASTAYTGAFSVGQSETIEALAIASGFGPSPMASAVFTLNLPPPAIGLTASTSSLTVTRGQSGTVAISLSAENGFNAATTFSCTGLPAGVTCNFAPPTVTPSGGKATTTLTVAASDSAQVVQRAGLWLPGAMLAAMVASFGLRRRRTGWAAWMIVAAAGLAAALTVGCGGSSSSQKPVTSNISVVATAGTVQQTVPLTITID